VLLNQCWQLAGGPQLKRYPLGPAGVRKTSKTPEDIGHLTIGTASAA
jgi:hypothetical protein